ncbi:unnamed protein product [Bursaphelenchus xylophilus]|uniref:(pine wood nematode) hypothetical protein n=1 Tax=Bursaphelenchus xylophilus TaxID=6326 RepID=A0A1I7S9F1_BURXY|nr:unnamed protein product [Bursaphelenchus xylophilus]CAG9100583.1 unnamed protein product [Bursaphelenchus xylophilus]
MTLKRNSGPPRAWGDYYVGGRKKRPWLLESVHSINQMIPGFSEMFDEETFYMFALIVCISAFLLAFFLSKVVGVRLKEHDIQINRQWRDWRPANPFKFPWHVAKEFQERMRDRKKNEKQE